MSKPGMATRLVAVQILTRVVDDGRNLDALCDTQNGMSDFLRLEQKDRALARAIAVSALRNRCRIETIFSKLLSRPVPKKARFLVHSLHVAATQILFLNVPDSAAVNLAVSSIGDDKRTSRFRSLANAVLRRMSREKDQLLASTHDGVLPKWLKDRLKRDYGKEKASQIGDAVSSPPSIDLTVKSNPEEWARKLDGIMLKNGTVRLQSDTPIHQLEGYEDGEWWVQDMAASIPARLITKPAGSDVAELCAAPGGKTAQLASFGYQVCAVDISKPRLARLQENMKRLKLEAELVEVDILEWEPPRLFDAILLDAPCSSTGTIRRHPDVMWTRTREEISELAQLQKRLLLKAASFLKPDGELVFSNCSMLKEEGENLLAAIKSEECGLVAVPIIPEEIFEMEELINGQGALRSLPFHMQLPEKPDVSGMDGFFACKFIRT